jgi:hypothetical protein
MTKKAALVFSISFAVVVLLLMVAHASSPTLVDCARAEARRNFAAFADFQCDMTSHRLAWKMDGTLDRDVIVVKKLYVKPPKKKEVFVSATLNGQRVQENDLFFERLGLADATSFSDIEVFRAGNEQRFRVEEEVNPAILFGSPMRVLKFTSLAPGQTNFQSGRMFLPLDSCRVVRLEGVYVQRMIVKNTVDFSANFTLVGANLWLPHEIGIKGVVNLGIVKRRMEAHNTFANYRINTGLTDAFFE